MSRRRTLLSSFLFSLSLLVLGACDADDGACADDTCERDERDQAGEPAPTPPNDVPCLPACAALTDSCGGDERGDTTAVQVRAACIDWCEAGGLSAEEAACFETLECNSAADCLAD
jgi:hypothetical protein